MHTSPEQLIALRDGEPVDAAVQMHVRECAGCTAAFDALRQLHTQLLKLPDFALPEGAWHAVSERLGQDAAKRASRHGRLRAASVAMVASIVIALALTASPFMAPGPTDTVTGGDLASAPVSQLVRQSRYLENAVFSLNANTDHMIISAGTAATVAALEDRIAVVDYEINHATVDPQDQARLSQLWQQRVNLLQSLAAVRYAQVASNDI